MTSDIEWRNGYPYRDGLPIPDPDLPNPGRYEPGHEVKFWPIPVAVIGLVVFMVIIYVVG